jgi:hypothetical protein
MLQFSMNKNIYKYRLQIVQFLLYVFALISVLSAKYFIYRSMTIIPEGNVCVCVYIYIYIYIHTHTHTYIDFPVTLKYQISSKSVHWEPSCAMRTKGMTDRQTCPILSHK